VAKKIEQEHGGAINRFEKGDVGNPKGRPKNTETLIQEFFLEEHNLKISKGQSQEILKVLLGKTKDELVELAKNPEMPWPVAMIVNKIHRDFKKGSMHALELIWDRVYGKPKEEVEQTVNGGKPDKVEIVIHRPEKK